MELISMYKSAFSKVAYRQVHLKIKIKNREILYIFQTGNPVIRLFAIANLPKHYIGRWFKMWF